MTTREEKARLRSPFAAALVLLLDTTNIYSRDEWARILGVSPPAISQWVNDKVLPESNRLWIMLTVLRGRPGAKSALKAFEELNELPVKKLSPHGHRFGSSLAEYMNVHLEKELQLVLATVPASKRSQVLNACIALCRKAHR